VEICEVAKTIEKGCRDLNASSTLAAV